MSVIFNTRKDNNGVELTRVYFNQLKSSLVKDIKAQVKSFYRLNNPEDRYYQFYTDKENKFIYRGMYWPFFETTQYFDCIYDMQESKLYCRVSNYLELIKN